MLKSYLKKYQLEKKKAFVVGGLGLIGKEITLPKYKYFERKMDKLRKANEQLRESGIYWHDACKESIRDLLGKQGK